MTIEEERAGRQDATDAVLKLRAAIESVQKKMHHAHDAYEK